MLKHTETSGLSDDEVQREERWLSKTKATRDREKERKNESERERERERERVVGKRGRKKDERGLKCARRRWPRAT